MRKKLNLYTHDGQFHADEVFATAMFSLMAEEINVVRGGDTEIPENTDEKRVMETLAELFIRNSGPVTAYIYRPNGKIISTGDGAGISRTEELKAALEELVGRENVKFGFLQ